MKKKLTDKQALFVVEYLVDLNATQAAIRAGYSKHTANVIGPENLAKPCISEAIAKANGKRLANVEINAAWVLSQAVKVHRRCLQEEAVTAYVDGERVETGEYKFDSAGANKALDLVGKHVNIKAFDEKELNATFNITISTADKDL